MPSNYRQASIGIARMLGVMSSLRFLSPATLAARSMPQRGKQNVEFRGNGPLFRKQVLGIFREYGRRVTLDRRTTNHPPDVPPPTRLALPALFPSGEKTRTSAGSRKQKRAEFGAQIT